MKIPILLTLCPLLLSVSVPSGTVLYTDSRHPPGHLDASVSVIYLDGPQQLQLFGALSSNPNGAERQVRSVMQCSQHNGRHSSNS